MWIADRHDSKVSEPVNPSSPSDEVRNKVDGDVKEEVQKTAFERPNPPTRPNPPPQPTDAETDSIVAVLREPVDGRIRVPACLLEHKKWLRQPIKDWNSDVARSSKGPATSLGSKRPAAFRGKKTRRMDADAIRCIVAPVSRDSIKELELSAIQNNLALRIDLCFDFELFFQKISGTKGEEKARRADIFYGCLSLELQSYSHIFRADCESCKDSQSGQQYSTIPSRLKSYLDALQELVALLVPESEREEVIRRLDTTWLARQIRIGQLDASSFSAWLSKLLMSHCAPIRDEMCRSMHRKISQGMETRNADLTVEGLRLLLDLLECMKLDVANHQVRSFKLLLISDSVPFLIDCFTKMIESEQLDPKRSQQWFKHVKNTRFASQSSEFCRFLSGLLDLCSSNTTTMPETFEHDQERLQALQHDIQDLVQMRICTTTYVTLVKRKNPKSPVNPVEFHHLQERIVQLMHSEEGVNEGVGCHLEEIAFEISRAVTAANGGSNPGAVECTMSTFELDPDATLAQLSARLDNQYDIFQEETMRQIADATYQHASRWQKLGKSTLDISIEQKRWSDTRNLKASPLVPDLHDISRRLAHIASIHWQVWSELVYLKTDSEAHSGPGPETRFCDVGV